MSTHGGTGGEMTPVPLTLDLLRHGAALQAGAGGDAARRLSPRGRSDLERLAAHLSGLGWRPGRAFTSPLVRAQESAALVLRPTAPELSAEVMLALRPDGDPAEVVEALAENGVTTGHALLVGHQPLLGLLAAFLTARPAPALSPGSLVRIEFTDRPEQGAGILGWRLVPDALA